MFIGHLVFPLSVSQVARWLLCQTKPINSTSQVRSAMGGTEEEQEGGRVQVFFKLRPCLSLHQKKKKKKKTRGEQ